MSQTVRNLWWVRLKWILLCCILAVGAYIRFEIPLDPMGDPDLWGYLGPAVSALYGDGFHHEVARSFPYPFFLLILIYIGGTIKVVTVVQHILGLVSAVLFFLIFDAKVFRSELPYTNVFKTLLQLIATTYYTLSTDIVFYEHSIRPEAFSTFLIIGLIFLLVHLPHLRGKKLYVSLGFAFFLNLFIYVVSPRWGVATAFVAGILLYLAWSLSSRMAWLSIAISLSLFIGVIALPERELASNDPAAGVFLWRQLFSLHYIDMIPLIQEDGPSSPYSPAVRAYVSDQLQRVPADKYTFSLLGMNPDALMYGGYCSAIEYKIDSNQDLSISKKSVTAFYKYYCYRFLTRHPGIYTAKVWKQLKHYYIPNIDDPGPWSYEYPKPLKGWFIPDQQLNTALVNHYFTASDIPHILSIETWPALNIFYYLFKLTPVLALLFFPAFIVLLTAPVADRGSRSLLCIYAVIGIIFCIHFGMVLTIALIHSFDVRRYMTAIFPFYLLLSVFYCYGVFCFVILKRGYIKMILGVMLSAPYKRITKNLTALALSLPVALLLGEVMVRIIHPVTPIVLEGAYHINLSMSKHHVFNNYDDGKKNIPGLDSVISVTKNQLGFRGPEWPRDTSRVYKIICVGGSTTQCEYVSDGKDWPEVLGKKLTGLSSKIWLNNAGLDGHSTFGHQIILHDFVAPLHPQMVIFLIGCNDVERSDLSGYDISSPDMGNISTPISLRLSHYSQLVSYCLSWKMSYDQSQLAKRKKLMHTNTDFRALGYARYDSSFADQLLIQNQTDYIPRYKQRLQRLIDSCQQKGILPIMMTQPTVLGGIDSTTGIDLCTVDLYDRMNGRLYWERLQLYNDAMRQICAANKVPLIDLAILLPKDTRYFYDFVHFNNAGCARVADIVDRELSRQQLISLPQ